MNCDIAIIGGGPVGLALALGLRDSDLNIVLLEARTTIENQADPRALALSYGSRLLLDKLDVWKNISQVTTIQKIRISQKTAGGRAFLSADEMDTPALGYVLPYVELHAALSAKLATTTVTILQGATVNNLNTSASEALITFQYQSEENTLSARLAIVADGGKLLEATQPPTISEYGQSALICHITCAHPQAATAFEFFTPQGPLALLPYRDGYEIVWTGSHQQVADMLTWDDATFLGELQRHFGDDVGNFLTVGMRSSYPLRLKQAPKITLPHTALIGNAAQTLHPVAGQGFNMGVRDAWELGRLILRTPLAALGSATMLDNYRQLRRVDRQGGIHFTDSLVRVFSNEHALLNHGRGAALSVLNCFKPAKQFVAKRMMFGANG
jgi:2-octaprenyl-6-methoxyphenol hydroxylase